MVRSSSKGPFVAYHLMKKLSKFDKKDKKNIIKTWSRSSTILPSMIGYTISVHNGQKHIPVFVSDQLVGHKLGEFAPTKVFCLHKKIERKVERKVKK